jgi:uncharacterized protein YegL
MNRRLPVYILIDCSESMIGEGLTAVRAGVTQMLSVLRQDPHALETAYISIISFGASAQVLVSLTEITNVHEPKLILSQGTALGAAIDLLTQQISKEVIKSSDKSKCDYRPIVILLTDGQPTDNWRSAKKRFDDKIGKNVANFYVVGCGQAIDYKSLSQISDIVLSLPDMKPDSMRKLFVWMTQTVSSASVGTAEYNSGEVPGIKILPKEIIKVEPDADCMPTASMQVFLPGICSLNKDRYVMRYVKDNGSSRYYATAAHKLNSADIEIDTIKKKSESETVTLDGGVPCPYCQTEGWVKCENCHIHFCAGSLLEKDNIAKNVMTTCPNCNSSLTLKFGGDEFEADLSRG